MKICCSAYLLGAMLALAPLPALAHSFQLGVIVPLTGPDSQRGTEALDGLRLATRERDGHPDETSDGHLGGLDSHLRPIDSARASSAEELKALVAERRLDLVTIATDRVDAGRLADAFADPAMPAFCPPGSGPVPIDDLEGAGARPFATSFRGEFGYPPTPEAAIGYNAGRAVDAAVRELGGVTDKAALVRLCSRAE